MAEDVRTCNEKIYAGVWPRRCSKPGRFWCLLPHDAGEMPRKGVRCGIHAKRYKKIEPYVPEQPTSNDT